jgi:acyl-CoA reductase-like NAD-dependent aldehyde dehydrogenase
MTIAGEAVAGEASFDVINPARGTAFATAPECSAAQLDAAFESASKAFGSWRTHAGARRAALLAAAEALEAAVDEMAPVLTAEQGKPLNEATLEVLGAAAWIRYYAALELPREVIQDDHAGFAEVIRKPIGVVAAITAWNFPLALACWKIAPALLAGNTVVLKPSPYTPLSTLKLGEVLRGIVPDGVLNIVTGGDSLGAHMTSHRVPRKISFTGSIETGKKIAASAAPDLKRVTLELGGNDPAILLDDIDPATIGAKLFKAAFANNGQVCSAIKRVYVPEALYDDVVESLAEKARAAKVGDGSVAGTELGPINNRPQLDRVSMLVADAIASGATAVAGGNPMEGDGYFFEPTILAGLTDGTRIVDEEQFGPALPVVSYRDIDDVVERANGTHYGLSASVWGGDADRAAQVADRIDCGTVWVNTHLAVAPHLPFGGAKWSGIGVENGPWGYYAYTELQVQYRAKNPAGRKGRR